MVSLFTVHSLPSNVNNDTKLEFPGKSFLPGKTTTEDSRSLDNREPYRGLGKGFVRVPPSYDSLGTAVYKADIRGALGLSREMGCLEEGA